MNANKHGVRSCNHAYGGKAAQEPEIMHSQALIYNDEEIREIAKYLSTLPKGLGD